MTDDTAVETGPVAASGEFTLGGDLRCVASGTAPCA